MVIIGPTKINKKRQSWIRWLIAYVSYKVILWMTSANIYKFRRFKYGNTTPKTQYKPAVDYHRGNFAW